MFNKRKQKPLLYITINEDTLFINTDTYGYTPINIPQPKEILSYFEC